MNPIIARTYDKVWFLVNAAGNKKRCYVCHKSFRTFEKDKGGSKRLPLFRKKLDLVGSDPDNYTCQFCKSTDRERHLFMYFDKLNFWDTVKNSEILHIAPEKRLSRKIEGLSPKRYIKGDLSPKNESITRVDATNISFPDNSFDLVMMNHVLEHIPAYKQALKEIRRVLRPGGIAILQTPFSRRLRHHFEDEGIDTKELKSLFHGYYDHLRTFSMRELYSDIEAAGFRLDIVEHKSIINDHETVYYGVNKKEDLIRAVKP